LICAKSASKLSRSTLCGKTGHSSLLSTVAIQIPKIMPTKASMIAVATVSVEDGLHMMLHGAFTDVESSSNLFVASAKSQIMQNLSFSLRELRTRLISPLITDRKSLFALRGGWPGRLWAQSDKSGPGSQITGFFGLPARKKLPPEGAVIEL
jgi:hypothetical protein